MFFYCLPGNHNKMSWHHFNCLPQVSKCLKIMKLVTLLILVASLQVSAKAISQQVTLSGNDISLKKVFTAIRKQTGYNFIYTAEHLENTRPVDIHVKNATLKQVLDLCFAGQPVSYQILNNTIIVKPAPLLVQEKKELPPPGSEDADILKGVVLDSASGKPLQGVTIKLVGENIGAVTDGSGAFSLNVSSGVSLEISFVGYQTKTVSYTGQTDMTIYLSVSVAGLQDVVVVGYGTVKKKDLTGSVVSLKADDFNSGSTNTSVAQLIQGRAAGVQVTQSSGAPGGGVSIRIRGAGSINAGNEPLYVIDGFPIDNTSPVVAVGTGFAGSPPPLNPLNAINPSDIESIEILKDASATAIYGSRGANGVVIITTKKGKSGRLNVDYTFTGSQAKVIRKLDLLNTSEYITVMNELAEARGNAAPFSEADIKAIGAGTDWQDVIFRTAYAQDHNLSLSGGSGKTNFFASFNYNDQDGVLLNSAFQRIQGRINLEHKASNKFKFGFNINTSQINNTEVPTSGDAVNQDADVINSATVIPPTFAVFDSAGNYVRPERGQIVSVTVDNPLALVNGTLAKNKINRTIGNVYGEYTILPGFSARINLGSDRSNSRRDVYQSTITQRGNSLGGAASILTGELSNTLFEGLLNYTTKIKQHNLAAVAGYTYQQFDLRRFNGFIQNFPSDLTGTNSLQLGNTNFDNLNSLTTRRILRSYLARVNYSYADKYLLTASFRADGSSNFGENHPYGYFPSFAGAWRISEEKFLNQSRILSDLKLRAGYGQIGNDDIGIGNAFATYSSSTPAVFGSTQYNSTSPARIPNPDLKWETTEQINMGIDFGFFNNRISGSLDYFIKSTKDLLINLPIPISTGFSSITTNVGKIRNSGFEILLNSVNIDKTFKWKTSFNLATLNNEVISTGSVPSIISNLYGVSAIARAGDPLFAYYGYQATGIFQSQEEVDNSSQKGVAVPGSPRWKDANADGKIDANDRVVLGKSFPDYTFGFSNTFSYKNISLNIFIDGAQNFSLFNFAIVDALYPNDPYRNRLAEPLLNRWVSGKNQTNSWPSSIDYTKYGGSTVNSFSVEDASFIRIKSIQLSYNIPFRNSNFIQAINVFVTGQNLKTFSDYLGFDPDVSSTSSSIVRVDRNAYPAPKTISLGLNVKF